MKDHQLGYPLAAQHSADVEEDARRGWSYHNPDHPFPLGFPQRVYAEHAARYAPAVAKQTALDDFECKAHAYPDGTYRTATQDCARSNFLINMAEQVNSARAVAQAMTYAQAHQRALLSWDVNPYIEKA